MEIHSDISYLFDTFASIWSKAVSQLSGLDLELGRFSITEVSMDQAASNAADRGVIISVPVTQPAPGMAILYIPLPYGAVIPERIINPDSAVVPDQFTELHRSALEEIAGQVWTGVAGEFSKKSGRPFETLTPEIVLNSLGNYLKKLPALMGIDSFAFIEYPARINRENFSIVMVMPLNFLTALAPAEGKSETVIVRVPEQEGGKAIQAFEVPLVEKAPAAGGARIKKKVERASSAGRQRPLGRKRNLEVLLDIPVMVTVELGKAKVPVSNIMNLATGSVVGLDTANGAPIRVLVNEQCVALGQVVTVGEKFGVRIVGLVEPEKRLEEF